MLDSYCYIGVAVARVLVRHSRKKGHAKSDIKKFYTYVANDITKKCVYAYMCGALCSQSLSSYELWQTDERIVTRPLLAHLTVKYLKLNLTFCNGCA